MQEIILTTEEEQALREFDDKGLIKIPAIRMIDGVPDSEMLVKVKTFKSLVYKGLVKFDIDFVEKRYVFFTAESLARHRIKMEKLRVKSKWAIIELQSA